MEVPLICTYYLLWENVGIVQTGTHVFHIRAQHFITSHCSPFWFYVTFF